MHNQIRKHCMTLFTSNRFDASLPYWLEMISDWSLYHLSPPRKLSASRSLTSSSERSSSGRSGQRGWSSPTRAAHWKREEMVEHTFANTFDLFIQCLWRNESSVSQKAMNGIITIQFSYDDMQCKGLFDSRIVSCSNISFASSMWSQTQTYQLSTVGSTDIKEINVGQASQHLVYGQQSRYKHVTGISLHTHLFNANSNNDKEKKMWDKKATALLKKAKSGKHLKSICFHCFYWFFLNQSPFFSHCFSFFYLIISKLGKLCFIGFLQQYAS